MRLAHFPAMLLFALVISVAFAFLSKQSVRDRLIYAVWSFLAFLLIALALAWIMFPFPRR
jgi:multidrug transporter EmrE-like cation transporter